MDIFGTRARAQLESLQARYDALKQELASTASVRDMLRAELHRTTGRVEELEKQISAMSSARVEDVKRIADHAFRISGHGSLFQDPLDNAIEATRKPDTAVRPSTYRRRGFDVADFQRTHEIARDALADNLGDDNAATRQRTGEPTAEPREAAGADSGNH